VRRFNPVSDAVEATPSHHQSVQSPRRVGSSRWGRRRESSLGVVFTIRGVRLSSFQRRTKSGNRLSGGPLSTRIGCVAWQYRKSKG
jgi:hypothetical protein